MRHAIITDTIWAIVVLLFLLPLVLWQDRQFFTLGFSTMVMAIWLAVWAMVGHLVVSLI